MSKKINKFKVGDVVRIIPRKKFWAESLSFGLSLESKLMLNVDMNSNDSVFYSNQILKIIDKSQYYDSWVVMNKLGNKYDIHFRLLEPHLSEKITKILNV